jgi:hypothetical protein
MYCLYSPIKDFVLFFQVYYTPLSHNFILQAKIRSGSQQRALAKYFLKFPNTTSIKPNVDLAERHIAFVALVSADWPHILIVIKVSGSFRFAITNDNDGSGVE